MAGRGTQSWHPKFWGMPYCWWKKNPANQLRLVVSPIIYRVLYIPGGLFGISEPSTLLQSQVELKELRVPQEQNLEDKLPSRSCGSWRCVELDEIFRDRVPQKEQGLGNMFLHIIYTYIYTCTQIRQTTNVIYIYVIMYAIICNMYIIYYLFIFRENIWMILEPVKFFPNKTRLYRCCLFGKPCFTFYYRKSPLGRSRNMFFEPYFPKHLKYIDQI